MGNLNSWKKKPRQDCVLKILTCVFQVKRYGSEAGHGVDEEVDVPEELGDRRDVIDDAGTRLAVHDTHQTESSSNINGVPRYNFSLVPTMSRGKRIKVSGSTVDCIRSLTPQSLLECGIRSSVVTIDEPIFGRRKRDLTNDMNEWMDPNEIAIEPMRSDTRVSFELFSHNVDLNSRNK